MQPHGHTTRRRTYVKDPWVTRISISPSLARHGPGLHLHRQAVVQKRGPEAWVLPHQEAHSPALHTAHNRTSAPRSCAAHLAYPPPQVAVARRHDVAPVLLDALADAVVRVRALVRAGDALEARILRPAVAQRRSTTTKDVTHRAAAAMRYGPRQLLEQALRCRRKLCMPDCFLLTIDQDRGPAAAAAAPWRP